MSLHFCHVWFTLLSSFSLRYNKKKVEENYANILRERDANISFISEQYTKKTIKLNKKLIIIFYNN